MNEPRSMSDATVKKFGSSLIRRTRFNAFDGGRVTGSLVRRLVLWMAVLLDSQGLAN